MYSFILVKARLYFQVVLGEADQSSIKTYDNDLIRITCGNVLNNVEYNRFWILWGRNFITLGERGTKDPLLKYKIKLPELKYVTFSVSDHGTPVHWRLECKYFFCNANLSSLIYLSLLNKITVFINGVLMGY